MSEPTAPGPDAPEPGTPELDPPEPTPAPASRPPLGFGDTVGEGFGLGCLLLMGVGLAGAVVMLFALEANLGLLGLAVGGVLIPAAVVVPTVLWARRRGWFRLAQGVIVAAVIGVALMDAVFGSCWSLFSS